MTDTATESKTTATPSSVTNTTTVSPGWRTSEHLLTLAAMLVGALLASNIIPADSVWLRVAGLVSTLLAALGYTWSRTAIKAAVQP
jgi:hypothetical protein